jgi:hypothetical protein
MLFATNRVYRLAQDCIKHRAAGMPSGGDLDPASRRNGLVGARTLEHYGRSGEKA